MNEPQTKLQPGDSEMTKLKAVWLRMSEADRGYWRELFASQQTQVDTRKKIAAKHSSESNA